ncbi:hypothetical protein CGRA01v4_14474 [Colletotrichum graminicola]|nr:hypothetical protein CGRA01v4_14474 [Colletotrichum graminicola]
MHYKLALVTLAATALAIALPEKCDPTTACCTFTTTACNTRLDPCTRTCNGVAKQGVCNDLGDGSLSCDVMLGKLDSMRRQGPRISGAVFTVSISKYVAKAGRHIVPPGDLFETSGFL